MRTMNDIEMEIRVRILNTSAATGEGGFIFVSLGFRNGCVYSAIGLHLYKVWWCATIYFLAL